MASSNNIIELNGKLYDANTGRLVGPGSAKSGRANMARSRPSGKSKSIDGFVSQTLVRRPKPKPSKPASSTKAGGHESARPKRQHAMAKNAAPHKRQHSRTLARTGIKKPTVTSRTAKSRGSSLPAKKSLKLPPTKHEVDESRQARAKHTRRSQFISRFQPSGLSIAGIGQAASAALPLRVKDPDNIKKTPKPHHSKTNDILMEGLARAKSHNEPQVEAKKSHKKTKKVIGWLMLLVVIVLVAGFFLYKVPAVNLQMVSLRAGVDASAPSYRPGGFVLSTPIHYSQGIVKLVYRSPQDTSFYLNESKSDWDSISLRDEFVSPADSNFQTVNSDGLTIYTYGSGQATWVSGGLWYQIGGNANLDQTQIIKIAASL